MIELINKIKERLAKYDLTFEKFKEYTLLLNITTPKKLARFYENLSAEQTFYLIAIVVFNQCDLLTGQKASFLEQENYSEWEKRVGEKRAENFKLAVFEEIKFRIFSNSFPEFANQQDIMNPVFSVRGESKEYKIISQILSPQSANFIINSHWNLLDFEGAQDYIKNFQEYLDKFVYKPFYRDLGALRALLLAKEMVLRTEIGEVMNLVSRHYAEFIFNKQIQEQFNKNIKQNIKELAELLEAKEIAILAKIADVEDELNTEVSALKNKDIEQDSRLLVIEDEQRIQNEKIENNENQLNDHINTSTTTITQLRSDFNFLKEDYGHYKSLFLSNDETTLTELGRLRNFVYQKFEEFGANTITSTTPGEVTLPNDVLTESNLNSKARSLSALTITPGNGTHNSSIFLKNNKANWEFYADANNGAFGIWDKLKNQSALNIAPDKKVDFYNEVNLHNYKIINVANPTVDKDAANKKYVDDINANITNSITEVKNKIAEINEKISNTGTVEKPQWQILIQDVRNDFYDYFDINEIKSAKLGNTKTVLLKIKYVNNYNDVCYGYFDLTNFWNCMLESETIDFTVTLFNGGIPYYGMTFTITFVLSLDVVKFDVRRVQNIENGDLQDDATCSIWLLRR